MASTFANELAFNLIYFLLSLPCTPDNLHVLVLGIFEPINGT
jgi:hypothetical protein